MREVIRVQDLDGENPVELVEFLAGGKWWSSISGTCGIDKIAFLGKDSAEPKYDLFAAYSGDNLIIYRGHLNSGKY